MNWHEWFASVEDVAVVGLLASAALVLLARPGRFPVRRQALTPLLRGERGAAYSLSLVMVLPFFMLVLALIVEVTLTMLVKIGTLYAAYAAARAALVWLPAEVPLQRRDEMIQLAAAQALTPFASAKPHHLAPTGRAGRVGEAGDQAFYAAFERYDNGRAPLEYLARKRQFALAATQVKVEVINSPRDPRLAFAVARVTVTYEKPIDLPIIGIVLGRRASWAGAQFFSRRIESTVQLPIEGPRSRSQTLGIRYDSWNY
jgi:hypothetical protein